MKIQQVSRCGDPDLVVCLSGRFVAMELKVDGNKATVLQAHKLASVTRSGGVGIVVNPDNWKQAIEFIDRLIENPWTEEVPECLTSHTQTLETRAFYRE